MKLRNILAVLAAPAIAVAVWAMPAHASATPTAQICGAFATWNTQRTTANANTLMQDVMALPWVKYVSEDMSGVYADYRGATKYLVKDVSYAEQDCAGS